MKLKRLLSALLVAVMILSGCKTKSSYHTDDSSVSEETEMDMELLKAGLEGCLGWGEGKAGASLNALQAAVGLLGFIAENSMVLDDETANYVDEFVAGLSEEELSSFDANIVTVCSDVDALIAGDKEVTGMLEDIGKQEDVADYLTTDNLKDKWAVLKGALMSDNVDTDQLETALNNCIGYGASESGSSLTELSTAVDFLAFISENDMAASKSITKTIDDFLEGLSKDELATFKENLPGVATTVESLIDQNEEAMGMLEDINAQEDVAKYLKAENLKDKWATLKTLIDQELAS
ncbi:MAG: hypothetical protein J6P61_05920 [Erysipelotrichaceae bacterium]|nr:hypothetical protein [Erysipelotrichaceae bacterium]